MERDLDLTAVAERLRQTAKDLRARPDRFRDKLTAVLSEEQRELDKQLQEPLTRLDRIARDR